MNQFQILVNAVVFMDDKVLISQRSWEEEHMPGRWTIPGGKVDQSDDDIFAGVAKPLEDTIDCKWASIDEVKAIDFPPNVKEYILEGYKNRL